MTAARTAFLRRLLPVFLVAGVTGCGNSPPPPPQVFPPLNYDYLPPIVLNVANLTVENNYVPDPAAATLIGEDPEAPADALLAMLQHRLVASGAPGNGTATIENASLEQVGDDYVGVMTVRLDLATPDNTKTGYTEASVSVTQTAPGPDASQDDIRAALYGITKKLMVSMNVQLQYQIQHNLGGWISYGASAAVPTLGSGAIQATPLGAPQPGAPQPAGLPSGSQSLGTLPITPPPSPPP